jgi:hypothetical protein
MNTKVFALLFLVFGVLFTVAQCGRLTERSDDDSNDDSAAVDNANSDSDEDNASLRGKLPSIH